MVTRRRERQRVRGATKELVVAARLLRREQTPAERVLWQALRRGQVDGLRFRRQYPVGTFVIDFFCPSHKLAVEVDGGIHDEPEQIDRDRERTEHLEAYGYHVLRIRNEDVLNNLSQVLGASHKKRPR